MKNWFKKYKHALLFLYFLIYLPWFFYLEKTIVTNYTPVHMKLDDLIPFNELFVIPYLLWFGYIAVTMGYFFFTSKGDFYRCCAFLYIGMTICLIIYTVWPNGQDLRPTEFARDNILVDFVKNLYITDTSTNVCPSIHVFNSIGAHIAISHSEKLKKHKVIVWGSLILAILISLSTVFLKQHSVFDGICAIGLSIVLYFLVYKVDYSKLLDQLKLKREEYRLRA